MFAQSTSQEKQTHKERERERGSVGFIKRDPPLVGSVNKGSACKATQAAPANQADPNPALDTRADLLQLDGRPRSSGVQHIKEGGALKLDSPRAESTRLAGPGPLPGSRASGRADN